MIELQYRMQITGVERLVTYFLEIGERQGTPMVLQELLRYKRGRYGSPWVNLSFKNRIPSTHTYLSESNQIMY